MRDSILFLKMRATPKHSLITKKNTRVNQKDSEELALHLMTKYFRHRYHLLKYLNKTTFPNNKYEDFNFSQGQLLADMMVDLYLFLASHSLIYRLFFLPHRELLVLPIVPLLFSCKEHTLSSLEVTYRVSKESFKMSNDLDLIYELC